MLCLCNFKTQHIVSYAFTNTRKRGYKITIYIIQNGVNKRDGRFRKAKNKAKNQNILVFYVNLQLFLFRF